MKNIVQNLAVIIATKDRPRQLQKLLISIYDSVNLPNKVVIVYSGSDISAITKSFQEKLNLEIIHSDICSQTYQKSIGIKNLKNNYRWILFLDDDVVLEANTIKIIHNEYLTNPLYCGYVGFGLSILNRSKRYIKPIYKNILRYFTLFSITPGTITKSGHAQSYLDHPKDIEVQWLNGISVWKSTVTSDYPVIPKNSSYSAYEDVSFSYKASKKNKLLFASKAKVINQITEGGIPFTINQFVNGGYLRYKFVCDNAEFSKGWLLIAQVVRGLDFIFRSNSNAKIMFRIKAFFSLWINLLMLVLKNETADKHL